jgi:hypothetical protein
MTKRLAAEFIGTLWLVLGGCGSAVLAAAYPALGIGFVGVALAFGLTVLTMAYAIGHVSGCHLNPAVSVGLYVGGRFPAKDVIPYIIVQVLGAIAGAAILYVIASGHAGFDLAAGFASNGYAEHSPGGYTLAACLTAEIVMTFGFPLCDPRRNPRQRPQGLCAHCNRPMLDPDSPHQHSCDEYLCESGTQHRPCPVRWRLGAVAAVAILARPHHRRLDRGRCLSLGRRR